VGREGGRERENEKEKMEVKMVEIILSKYCSVNSLDVG
jgi:hypothetical protein